MTNAQINNYIKDIYTVFRKYRDIRPIPDDKKAAIWDELDAAADKYAEYRTENPLEGFANDWIYKTAKGLFNELERAETA